MGTKNFWKTWCWLIALIIILLIAGILILLRGNEDTWIKDDNGSWQKHGNPSASIPAASATVSPSKSSVTNSTESLTEKAQNGDDWAIYKNYKYSYLIEYPKNQTIENYTFDDAEKKLSLENAKCIKISSKYTSVTIQARNTEPDIDCIGGGFGQEWGKAPDEQVMASGVQYTAKGMKTESASAGYYQDNYSFVTASGEVIVYTINVNEKYDDQMTKAQAKELVHKIIASFNPAE